MTLCGGICLIAMGISGCHSQSNNAQVGNSPAATSGGSGTSSTSGSTGQTGVNGTTGGTGSITVPPENGGTTPPTPKKTPGIPIVPYKKGPMKPLQISPKGTDGWVQTSKTSTELADLADKSMKILNDAGFDAFVTLNLDQGRGMSRVHGDIANLHKYRVQYESWAGDHPGVVLVVSNGTMQYTDRESVLSQGDKSPERGPLKPVPVESGLKLLNNWLTDMPAYVTGWYRFLGPVYSPLVEQLNAPSNQFKVTVEKRVTPYQGQLVTNYRILATRSPDSTLGYAELEIVLDGDRFLPVTVRSRYRFPGAGPNEMMWSGHWFPQVNSSKKFQLPLLPQKKP